jgi:hypothetical protein
MYALVASGILICFIDDEILRRLAQKAYFIVTLLTLATFAAARSPNVDRDYEDYAIWFNAIAAGTATKLAWIRDPAFAVLAYIVSRIGLTYSVVEFIYAFLGLTATWRFAVMASAQRWVTLFFYLLFCQYYIVGEMTEIRAAVAIPLMATSLYLACDGRRFKAIGVFCLALAFHFSVIVGLPLLILLLAKVELRSRLWIYAFAVLACVASLEMGRIIDALSNVYRISEYLGNASGADNKIGGYWFVAAHIVLLILCLELFWKKMSLHQRLAILGCGFGTWLFLAFGSNRDLATRLLYLFDFYWLLLFMVIVEKLKGYQCVLYAMLLTILGSALYILSLQYVEPYSTYKEWDASLSLPVRGAGLYRVEVAQ